MANLRPLLLPALVLALWQFAAAHSSAHVFPTPRAAFTALVGLAASGALAKHVIASVFRITWGFLLASMVAIPCGMLLALNRRSQLAVQPLLQILRPISPLAWTPLAVLWFGIGDVAAIFLIFIACAPTLTLIAYAAVRNVRPGYVDAGRNFGFGGATLIWRVVLPAAAPQLLAGMRTTLAIAWSVLVAGEMLAVNSGLGFLIMDARNAGNRFDLVFAGMFTIGAVGFALDAILRRLEQTDFVRWAVQGERASALEDRP